MKNLAYNPTVVIGGLFFLMIITIYFMKKQGEKPLVTTPPPAGTPLQKYPDWRILPYDPYYKGPRKNNPFQLHMNVAPLSPSVWSSTYSSEPYDLTGYGRTS
jgi:quinol-cytochrome oxidoreductase complex cytochrome b subunit